MAVEGAFDYKKGLITFIINDHISKSLSFFKSSSSIYAWLKYTNKKYSKSDSNLQT